MDAIRVADEADETDPLAVLNRLSSICEQMDELCVPSSAHLVAFNAVER